MNWKSIESAPRDGGYILLAGDSGYMGTPLRVEVGRYVKDYSSPWRNHGNDAFEDGGESPKFWLPLPEIPKL